VSKFLDLIESNREELYQFGDFTEIHSTVQEWEGENGWIGIYRVSRKQGKYAYLAIAFIDGKWKMTEFENWCLSPIGGTIKLCAEIFGAKMIGEPHLYYNYSSDFWDFMNESARDYDPLSSTKRHSDEMRKLFK